MSILFLASLAKAAPVAGGSAPAISAQEFRPSIDGQRTLWVDDAARLDGPLFRPLLHYTSDPLIYLDANGDRVGLVTAITQLDALAGYGFGRVRFGLDLPVYLLGQGDAGDETGLGDVAGEVKLTAIDGPRAPFDLALSVRGTLPTTTVSLPLGEPNAQYEASLIVSREIGDFLVTANAGYAGGPATELENVRLNDAFVYRGALAYAIGPRVGIAGELAGRAGISELQRATTPLEWLASGYARVADPVVVRVGGGTGITGGIGSPDFRALIGVGYEPGPAAAGPKDQDQDGIVDADDACPDVAEDLDQHADQDGCPERTALVVKVVDETGAEIPGASVAVTGAATLSGASGASWDVDPGHYAFSATAPGHQLGKSEVDVGAADDRSVVTVTLAENPGILEVQVVDPAGAPVKGAAFLVDGHAAMSGAAVPPGEHAVVVDVEGYQPATATATVASDQTATVRVVVKPSKVDLKGDRITLRDSVYFDLGQATIQARSFSLLDDVVAVMSSHPELLVLRIEGHTDSRGPDAFNLDLSQRRAAEVRNYLVSKGVAPDRLVSEGFGETKPIDPAENAVAWEKNRRVDFFVQARAD